MNEKIASDRLEKQLATPPQGEETKLQEAAQDALAGWRYIRRQHGDLPGVGWDRVETALTEALSAQSPPPPPSGEAIQGQNARDVATFAALSPDHRASLSAQALQVMGSSGETEAVARARLEGWNAARNAAVRQCEELARECRGSDEVGPGRTPESCYEYAAAQIRTLSPNTNFAEDNGENPRLMEQSYE